MKPTRIASALLMAGVCIAGSAQAAATGPLPAERHQGSVAFLTGGVGKDEAKAFEAAEKRFPLALEFVDRVGKRDEFVAGTEVKVTDPHGKTVLSTTADGPFLLAKIPSGRYTVAATYDGKTMTRHVVAGAKARHPVVFEWRAKA
jgi:hypothetical protein